MRLTIRNSDGSVSQPTSTTIAAVFEKLAAYEDTGLEPGEIADNMEMLHAYRHVCAGFPPEKISELAQAEQEGRLVVLPCKVGDTVWRIETAPCAVKNCDCGNLCSTMVRSVCPDYTGGYVIRNGLFSYYDREFIGKTVFLTREEAERALEVSG